MVIKDSLVISGFPGIGKSHLAQSETNLVITDSDSSNFSWASPGVRDPTFPLNYMIHVKKCLVESDIVLVSSHAEVRAALVESNILFTLVYPGLAAKEAYLSRYEKRGSPASFLTLLDKNWNMWLDELDAQDGCNKTVLGSNQYLSDVINELS